MFLGCDRLVHGRLAAAWTAARAVRRPTIWLVMAASALNGCGYGRISELEEQVNADWYDIEVQLQRRTELVPALLQTVGSYEAVGEELANEVADARARLATALQTGDISEIESANATLCAGLERMVGGAASSPGLRSDPGFQLMRSQLEETQQQVITASRAYNAAVRRYNGYIAVFPQLVTARVVGARQRQLFRPDGAPAAAASPDE